MIANTYCRAHRKYYKAFTIEKLIMPIEDRLFIEDEYIRSAMATRKGINVSGNYAAPHILNVLFICVLCILKNGKLGQNRILHSF